MTNDEKLMAQALEALARFNYDHHWGSSQRPNWFENSITALRERLAQNREMDEAIAAGDGTLHGAIDYWQERALKAEARLAQRIDPAEHDKTCAALLQGERYPCDCKPSAEPVAYRYRYIDGWRTNGGGPVNGVHPVECQPLYTAPPKRTPLTDEEINDEMDRLLLSPVEQEAFGSGVRYAERKHGIGEKK